ncbi:MAG TPA: carboxylesterase family protein [Thermoleophilaceae bacterium]|nr:carboxylesterase family protein [Thermoleophilaceae bacterium]
MQKLVVASVVLFSMAVPAAANAAVRDKLGVQYGSAVDFAGQQQALELDLYRPPERRKPRAVVIWVHGGGFVFGERSYMTLHANAFAERGYVSATITYRLARDRLSQVGYVAAARAAQHDAQAAVRWFRRRAERLNIDPRRIFIAGHSAGAFTALEVAVSREDPGLSGNPGYSSRVRGAISISGGLIDQAGIERGDAPMLLIHGDIDQVVPFGASQAVCAAAKEADVSCELSTLVGGDHYVPYTRFDEVVQITADWIRARL